MDDKQLERLEKDKVVEQIKSKATLGFDNHEMKRNLIQSSFWMAESSIDKLSTVDQAKKEHALTKVKTSMTCPADGAHDIKIKDFFPLTTEHQHFVCFASKKKLVFQKIVALRPCGHMYIKEFFDSYIGKSSSCLCGKAFLEGDVIKIEPAKSAFCDHNAVIATLYEPSFAC